MSNLMNTLIEQADANRDMTKFSGMWSHASTETAIGKVACYRDYKVGGAFSRNRPHARTNWKLNGAVIPASALIEALKQI
jgi:hypothetical protein